MNDTLQSVLSFTGTLLFLFGLLTGFAVPVFRSPRIGLSAHLAALQSGLTLIAFAWLGGRLVLPDAWAAAITHTLWVSLYVLWVGLVFSAICGTGRTLPIAGAGMSGKRWQERPSLWLVGGGSIGSAFAVASLLFQWSWRAV